MIQTKDDLKKCLDIERDICFSTVHNSALYAYAVNSKHWVIWQYLKTLRNSEYHLNSGHKIRYAWYHRKLHKISLKTGIEIPENTVDSGLTIYHVSPIVISGGCKVGKNFKVSGNLCVGKKCDGEKEPVIGDNVWAGWGANVIGNIHVADNVTLGASCVVVNSIETEGAKVAGIPARIVG